LAHLASALSERKEMSMGDPIKHVVVLALENHSFDQILGDLKSVAGLEKIEGVDAKNPLFNCDHPDPTQRIAQCPTELMSIDLDPHHEHVNVLRQIANGCGGFVSDFAQSYSGCRPEERQQIMAYYRIGSLPVIHTLAQNFLVCDHWFSSLPGPTWPNRFFIHSGTSKGHVKMPAGLYIRDEHLYDQATIYDLLDQKGIKWSIYHHGMPQSMMLEHLWDKFDQYHRIDGFFADAKGKADAFPEYAFIEPSYGGPDQNDQHPPTDIRKGEILIAQIYNALRANEDLWRSTLFVLLYDEHGGFYDHVEPPKNAVPPDNNSQEFSFTQYGVRVPAILISPWVDKGFIPDIFDHTSLLKYAADKWGLDAAALGARTANAASFAPALAKRSSPRTDTPGLFDLAALPSVKTVLPNTTNEFQNSLVSFSHFLEAKMSHVEELAAVGYRSLKSLDGALAQLSVAKDRFLLFLHHGQQGRLDDNS
jgi:phospholipase C